MKKDLLHIGRMSSKELSNWFGLTKETFYNNRKQLLEELKVYCDFRVIHGGIVIRKVYIEKYIPFYYLTTKEFEK